MTLESEHVARCLYSEGITKLIGVPDSVLSGFCLDAADIFGHANHLTAANEGNAIAIAIGHHLATSGLAAVYMQNSGLGNAINPLVSLASTEVYSIPMLLVIGWRGMPGTSDEPQHRLQGRVTEEMLDCIGIPHQTLCTEPAKVEQQMKSLIELATQSSAPVALLIPKGSMTSTRKPERSIQASHMTRELALQIVLQNLDADTRIVSTTGMLSRELYENTRGLAERHCFMTVGGMGHAAAIALGLAHDLPNEPIVCLDGDGAALMHLGSMVSIGQENCANLIHILFNNGVHDSVGGQATVGDEINFASIALECHYASAVKVSSESNLISALERARSNAGVSFIEILVKPGNRADIGRPKEAMVSLKPRIMKR